MRPASSFSCSQLQRQANPLDHFPVDVIAHLKLTLVAHVMSCTVFGTHTDPAPICAHTFPQAPIDNETKNLLLGGAGLTGTVAIIAGVRAIVSQLQAKVAESAGGVQKAVMTVGFFGVVFLAARAILESN